MIGEWITENVGTTLSIASAVYVGASWILVHWIGDRFEPKKPTLTEDQKRLAIEEKARAVLSTDQIGLFAEATRARITRSVAAIGLVFYLGFLALIGRHLTVDYNPLVAFIYLPLFLIIGLKLVWIALGKKA